MEKRKLTDDDIAIAKVDRALKYLEEALYHLAPRDKWREYIEEAIRQLKMANKD